MNRNAESHFAVAPANVDIARSQFDRSHGNTFSANFGELIPCYVEEVLPGDTFQVKTSKVVRLQTLLKPVMGNMYLDTYYFFVPNRLIWQHWQEFCGESNEAWTPSVEYTIPQLVIPEGGFDFGSLADYLGVPPGRGAGQKISHLPFRAYGKIVDDWFRNQNLEDAINVYTGDADFDGSNDSDSELLAGKRIYIAGKYHDLFTSCLPAPQKGPAVNLGVGFSFGDAPVRPMATPWDTSSWDTLITTVDTPAGERELFYAANNDSLFASSTQGGNAVLNNLGVDTSSFGAQISVSDLRMSFAVQRFYERMARSGSRYIEILKSMFNVTSPDARLQRSEYLGGNRMPIAVSQVTNNAETEVNPLGNVGAMSLTNDVHNDFIHSFVEHGYVIGVCVARYEHSYPTGLPKHFSRKSKFDYYWPVFANISEQPVYKREIFFDDDPDVNDQVFGYQEPWAHYRFSFNSVHGEMRPDHPQTLASWNLADDYEFAPSLSHEWAMESKSNVDRTLAVTSSVSNQILVDMWFNNLATRPMPLFSVPGLIDHN